MSVRDPIIGREVRVAFVEQHALLVETFAVAVRTVCTPCPVLVAPEDSAQAIAAAVLAVRPDVAVLHLDTAFADHQLPIERLTQLGIVTTVLTDGHDDARLGRFVQRGAEAALSAAIGLSRLVTVIDRAAARRPAMDRAELERLRAAAEAADTRRGADVRERVSRLSVREGEVLRQLMAGLAPAAIARRGWVSEATVRTQVRSILAKLDVGSQLAAVAVAYRAGWQPVALDVASYATTG